MATLFLYIGIFAISTMLVAKYTHSHRKVILFKIGNIKNISTGELAFIVCSLLCMLPIILIYGLREGVGTDYYGYEKIYNVLHNANFKTYFRFHLSNSGSYYVEMGYYFLNRLANNYHVLLTIEIILIFICLFDTLKDYRGNLNMGLAVFIFLSTQFIYSTNAARFSIALSFVLLSYKYIIKEDFIRFIICIILAGCFHKTALFCIALFFLQEFTQSYINKIRNALMMAVILLFPLISQYLFNTFGNLSIFARYFSTERYASNQIMDIGFSWLLHIIPVIIPLLIFGRYYIADTEENRTLFRIYLMNIPFRMLGLYNTWYTRFARYSQVVEVLFVPLVLYRIPNKKIKRYLTIYYLIWYTFYFCYYAIVNDGGASLSYSWILSR